MTIQNAPPHGFIFEISPVRGHVASYLKVLISQWNRPNSAEKLTILTLPTLAEKHPELITLAKWHGVNLIHLTDDEFQTKINRERTLPAVSTDTRRPTNAALLYDWQLLTQYVASLGATHCFIPRINNYLLFIAHNTDCPAPLSGIYFGPVIHETNSGNQKLRIKQVHERFLLSRSAEHPKLTALFMLNPAAVNFAKWLPRSNKIHALRDPATLAIPINKPPIDIRQRHHISADSKLALLLGDLSPRKGVLEFLAAVKTLSVEETADLTILLVGTIRSRFKRQVEEAITRLQTRLTCSVVLYAHYIPEHELYTYFDSADLILMPYINHTDSSGILLQAAAAQTPVLAAQQGLVGELVEQFTLGSTVNPRDSAEVASTLAQWLRNSSTIPFSAERAAQLVARHHPSHFANAIFEQLLTPPS